MGPTWERTGKCRLFFKHSHRRKNFHFHKIRHVTVHWSNSDFHCTLSHSAPLQRENQNNRGGARGCGAVQRRGQAGPHEVLLIVTATHSLSSHTRVLLSPIARPHTAFGFAASPSLFPKFTRKTAKNTTGVPLTPAALHAASTRSNLPAPPGFHQIW